MQNMKLTASDVQELSLQIPDKLACKMYAQGEINNMELLIEISWKNITAMVKGRFLS